jgi:hypothetical protein
MKRTLCAVAALATLLLTNSVKAQDNTSTKEKKKKRMSLSISKDGFSMRSDSLNGAIEVGKDKAKCEPERKRRLTTSFGMVDLGFNLMDDKTNYADPLVQSYLHVLPSQRNASLFNLNTGKSVNVNITPFMAKYAIVKNKSQKIYISAGLGLQLYNFRYERNITYLKDPLVPLIYRGDHPTDVIMDTLNFKKNKLALDYLNIPVMLTFKTRIDKKHWLVYGVGATGGLRIGSWTKQVSQQYGKVKNSDDFGTGKFNACVSAEIGIDGMLRFYGSYQVTSLFDNALDQHPFCVGFRINGI